MKYLVLLFWFFFIIAPTTALQKVIILPIININKDKNFAYLEQTITESLKTRLKEKLAFDELAEQKWRLVAEENFILPEDLHTKTAGMNLGILANQDIVIGGGFKPVNKKGKGGKMETSIQTTMYLLDVKKKITLATVERELPADNNLFSTVGQVAEKMEMEARKIIPSKEEVSRTGYKEAGSPFFSDFSIGLRIGGGVYVSGYAKYFTPQLPAIGFIARSRIPKLGEKFISATEFLFLNHKLKEGNDSALQALGVASNTSNYIFMLSFGYQIGISGRMYLEPQLGAGYVLQTTSVTGNGINSTVNNGFPAVKVGIHSGYTINSLIDLTFTLETFAFMEKGVITYTPTALAGVNYKFGN